MKRSTLIAALLLGLGQVSAVLAAPYQVTVTGTLDSAITGTFDSSFGYDFRSWAGKSYALSFILDTDPAHAIASTHAWDEVPTNTSNQWKFDPSGIYKTSLAVGGSQVFSGNDLSWNHLQTFNNQYVPDSLASQNGLSAGTYDGLSLETGHFVGCGGTCGTYGTNVVQEIGMYTDHVWSGTSAIANDNMPDLFNAPPNFGAAVISRVGFEAARYNEINDTYSVAYTLYGDINGVTVTAVPEPETYAMLLAGLGLIGWQRRRRSA